MIYYFCNSISTNAYGTAKNRLNSVRKYQEAFLGTLDLTKMKVLTAIKHG